MGRVRAFIEINGNKRWTLFDSGAENTYVTKEIAMNLVVDKLDDPIVMRLGGKKHTIQNVCILKAKIEGKFITTAAFVVPVIGYDKKAKRYFETLLGAIALQNWGIELDLKRERLDLSRYPDEFWEF